MTLPLDQTPPIRIEKTPAPPALHWPAWPVLLPTLATAAAVVVALALLSWLVSRRLRRAGNAGAATPAQAALGLGRTVRHMAAVVGAVAVGLVLVRGFGIGVPRLTWQAASEWLTTRGVRLLLIFLCAWLVIRIVDSLIANLQSALLAAGDAEALDKVERQKRVATVGKLIRGVTITIAAGIAILMALRQLDVDITPMLTGAGILGVGLGFGSQTLVKDVLSGFFLILENQMRVGDMITINGETGILESLRLRITVLRGQDGTVYVFQNGSISQYANLTKDFSFAVVTLSVGVKEDLDRVTQVLQEVGDAVRKEAAFQASILGPLEVLGVQSVGGAGNQVSARMRTVPMEQWKIGSELRLRIQQRFEKENITLA